MTNGNGERTASLHSDHVGGKKLRLLIGAGGVGSEILHKLTEEAGIRFNTATNDDPAVNLGILLDSAESEVGKKSPRAEALKTAGIELFSVEIPNQDSFAQTHLPSGKLGTVGEESNAHGCNSRPMVAELRMEGLVTHFQGIKSPEDALRSMIEWAMKADRNFSVNSVEVIAAGGMCGGTGEVVARETLAIALKLIKDLLPPAIGDKAATMLLGVTNDALLRDGTIPTDVDLEVRRPVNTVNAMVHYNEWQRGGKKHTLHGWDLAEARPGRIVVFDGRTTSGVTIGTYQDAETQMAKVIADEIGPQSTVLKALRSNVGKGTEVLSGQDWENPFQVGEYFSSANVVDVLQRETPRVLSARKQGVVLAQMIEAQAVIDVKSIQGKRESIDEMAEIDVNRVAPKESHFTTAPDLTVVTEKMGTIEGRDIVSTWTKVANVQFPGEDLKQAPLMAWTEVIEAVKGLRGGMSRVEGAATKLITQSMVEWARLVNEGVAALKVSHGLPTALKFAEEWKARVEAFIAEVSDADQKTVLERGISEAWEEIARLQGSIQGCKPGLLEKTLGRLKGEKMDTLQTSVDALDQKAGSWASGTLELAVRKAAAEKMTKPGDGLLAQVTGAIATLKQEMQAIQQELDRIEAQRSLNQRGITQEETQLRARLGTMRALSQELQGTPLTEGEKFPGVIEGAFDVKVSVDTPEMRAAWVLPSEVIQGLCTQCSGLENEILVKTVLGSVPVAQFSKADIQGDIFTTELEEVLRNRARPLMAPYGPAVKAGLLDLQGHPVRSLIIDGALEEAQKLGTEALRTFLVNSGDAGEKGFTRQAGPLPEGVLARLHTEDHMLKMTDFASVVEAWEVLLRMPPAQRELYYTSDDMMRDHLVELSKAMAEMRRKTASVIQQKSGDIVTGEDGLDRWVPDFSKQKKEGEV